MVTKYIIYEGLEVYVPDQNQEIDLSRQDKMFVELNFKAQESAGFVLGEVIKLYEDDGVVKADIKIYGDSLKRIGCKSDIEFEWLVPAFGGSLTIIGESKTFKPVQLSLGINNINQRIKSIVEQLEL